MDSREKIKRIIAGEQVEQCGLWLGSPLPETWTILFKYFGIDDGVAHSAFDWPAEEMLRRRLQDDLRWFCPQWSCYRHPGGKPLWDNQHDSAKGLASVGVLAECEDPAEVEKIEWPSLDYCDFGAALQAMKDSGPYYRAGGMWCSFFHDVADFFGMEDYFVKMYSDPEMVDEVTRRVCEFYLAANERFFEQAGAELDGFFFGNDFGTQLDLLISPDLFDRFILPWIKKFADQAHAHGYQVIAHSCGSVNKVIDRLIGAGVQGLHPLQAKAVNMDAATLAERFQGRIAFMGGVDTQHLLVHGTPAEVREEVFRIRKLLGPRLIVSPSHEALLPNVRPENIEAMAQAVLE